MEALQKNPYNLLIAEDDEDDYLFFTIALKETSFTIRLSRALNGEELMDILLQSIPDILFLDLHMPSKDGQQCIREIRSNERYDALPVIVYSSRNDPSTIDQCYRAGTNFFAIKPGSISGLRAMLERILTIDWKASLYYPTKEQFVLRADQIN